MGMKAVLIVSVAHGRFPWQISKCACFGKREVIAIATCR